MIMVKGRSVKLNIEDDILEIKYQDTDETILELPFKIKLECEGVCINIGKNNKRDT